MKITKAILFILLIRSSYTYAQFDDVRYDNEFIYGITTNTNVLLAGFYFKYSNHLRDDVFHHLSLDISNIKNPKEQRFINEFGNAFIPNKESFLFPIRLSYGRELILFRKTPYEGMQMSWNLSSGPTFGILKPYFVLFQGSNSDIPTYQPYDPDFHENRNNGVIVDGGGMFRGLNLSELKMGMHIRSSLALEFGKFGDDVAGLELGFLVEGYEESLSLMSFAPKQAVFSTAFLTLYYGKRK